AARSARLGIDRAADPAGDVLHLKPEDVRRDDGNQRRRPGPQVLGSAGDFDGAVGVDRAGGLGLARAAAPGAQRAAETALDRARRLVAARVPFLLPPDPLVAERDLALIDRLEDLERARVGDVLEAELQRIEAELVGQVVHDLFHHDRALGVARGSQRTAVARIDGNVRVLAAPRLGRVDVRQRELRAARVAARAVGDGVERGQLSVLRRAGLDLRERRRAVARGPVLLVPLQHQLDGALRLPRELRRDDALDVGPELAAEAAAHERRLAGDLQVGDGLEQR